MRNVISHAFGASRHKRNMESLNKIINQQFYEKYAFLKPFEVVYNTTKNVCTLTFLFPENQQNFDDAQKKEVANFLRKKLDLQAKVEVRFRRSYLDQALIKEKIQYFFEVYHKAINSVMDASKIQIKRQNLNVQITLSIAEKVLKNLNIELLDNQLTKFLSDNFCANFECVFVNGENYDEEKLAESDREEFKNILRMQKPTERYEVFAPVKIVGKDISPFPEFLSKIKEDKPSVILAGTIQNIEKRSYKRQFKNQEVERYYFKFELHEDNRWLRMLHFANKAEVPKMEKLANGDTVLVVCDIKKENKYLTGFVKSLSLCQIGEKVRFEYKEQIRKYTTIFPEPYSVISQANIFDVKPTYNELINGKTYVVFDVETTGLEPEFCEIIEIGAVKVVNGEITEKFQTLVKPKSKISSLITEITGITNDMVDNAPPIEAVIKDFFLFSKDSILSGYNVGFDMKFILKAGGLVSLKFENEVIDVLPLVKENLDCKNYKLGTVVKHLQISLENAHRAFFDALATAEVLLALSKT